MNLLDLRAEAEDFHKLTICGCLNHDCVVSPTEGMGTTSTCKCYRTMLDRLNYMKKIVEGLKENSFQRLL